jgi:hypothetical protein
MSARSFIASKTEAQGQFMPTTLARQGVVKRLIRCGSPLVIRGRLASDETSETIDALDRGVAAAQIGEDLGYE